MSEWFYDLGMRVTTLQRSLSAPALSRTSSTILLLWERPSAAKGEVVYDVYRNSEQIGSTGMHCYTAKELEPGTWYRFSVIARDEEGKSVMVSDFIDACTKQQGQVFNIKDFGAAGDGKAKDTAAFRDSISACTENGTVYVPAGIYLVDYIELKSNMTFCVDKDATITFAGRGLGDKYPETSISLDGPDGEVEYTVRGLVSGIGLSNITICGEGKLFGCGNTWWKHPTGYTGERPFFLHLVDCKDVLIQGIHVIDAPFHTVVPTYCENLVCNDLKIMKTAPEKANNGDGLNPSSCRNVLICGVTFANQDDSIAIKTGAKLPENGYKAKKPNEYIVIRDCVMDGTLGTGDTLGFAIGSGIGGGVRHIVVRDCIMKNVKYICHIKDARGRGGFVEDLHVENIKYYNDEFYCHHREPAYPIFIEMHYWWPEYSEPTPASELSPVVRNISFENIDIICKNQSPIGIMGLPEKPFENITFTNVRAESGYGAYCSYVDGLVFDNVEICAKEGASYILENVKSFSCKNNK